MNPHDRLVHYRRMKISNSLRRPARAGKGVPPRVYSSDGGSLVEIHDMDCACVVLVFSAESEGACRHAQARPEIRGEGDVWLHWSCACCGEAMAHCHPIEVD